MAKSNTFQCSVVTPEQTVLDCEVTSVVFPAHDGELGVLLNRAPLVCKLGIGRLHAVSPEETHTMFIDGGFAEVVGNRLTILTEQACRPDEIDTEKAGQSLSSASFEELCDGKWDHLPEQAFMYVGTIEEAEEKAKALAKD